MAQSDGFRCERFSVEDGLSHNAVSSIAQDRLGFLWFGTQDGLNRYDGTQFTVFRNNPRDSLSLSSSNILNMFADRNGNIWSGSNGFGLSRFDPEKGSFKRYKYDPSNREGLNSNTIKGIFEDRHGTIWIGTDKGLNSIDPATGRCVRYRIPGRDSTANSDGLIYRFFDDGQGQLWIGHNNGVAVFEYADNSLRQIVGKNISAHWISGDGAGHVWIGTEQNILQFQTAKNKITSLTMTGPELQNAAQKDNNDLLWWIENGRLVRYDPHSSTSKFFLVDSAGAALLHIGIRSVFVDRSGIVWIGTYNGIYKLRPSVKHFSTIRFASSGVGRIDRNNVRSFAEDPHGWLWIGTLDGFYRFDPRTKRSVEFSKRRQGLTRFAGTAVWSIIVDSTIARPVILAGNSRLLFKDWNLLKEPIITRIPPEIEKLNNWLDFTADALFQDRQGSIWIGLRGSGIAEFDPRKETIKRFTSNAADPKTINTGAVFAICETKDGSLWFGLAGGGLNKLDRETGTFTHYVPSAHDANSLSDNSVLSLLPDEDGILWIGTYAGLNRFDTRRGEFRLYTTMDGLANNVIYGILKDHRGNLWLSSNKGITRFNPGTGTVKNYAIDDGLQDYEFNHNACLTSTAGEMYFGGIKGFNMFHPDSVKDNPVLPNIVLVDLKILNRTIFPTAGEERIRHAVPITDSLFLNYNDASMTFEFAALEFTQPSLNQYAYTLEGFDTEWQYVGTKHEVTYTNLDPGTYTLRAKGSNNDGVWSKASFALVISIAPPWWKTWWFRGAAALLFLSVGPFIYYRRITSLKRQHAAQQEFSRRLIESQEKERQRIAAELHDGLGQDLLVIKNRALMADQVKRLNPDVKVQLHHILNTVTNSLHSVRQTARNLRPYHLDRFGLTGAIRSTLENVAESSSISFEIAVDQIDNLFPRDTKEMEVNVFRIVQESINNIIKHAEAKHVLVRIDTQHDSLNLLVKDDGKGFDPAGINGPDSKAGMGISGISERVRILGGVCEITSSPGAGTSVSVSIPLTQSGKS